MPADDYCINLTVFAADSLFFLYRWSIILRPHEVLVLSHL